MNVDPDWWKKLFDEVYLLTDARSVCDEAVTRREVDLLQQLLGLEKPWPILDLCGGQGRHAMELSRRGFENVTVLDYSKVLIDLGRKKASEEGLKLRFIQADARATALPAGSFRAVLVMASSFGYFVEEEQNQRVLEEAFRLLRPNGRLLLDLPNRQYVISNFSPRSRHKANNDIVVIRRRRLDGDILYSRERVVSRIRGLLRDASYCIRLYSPEKITLMLLSAGFESIDILTDFVSHGKEGDYGCMTNRMVVIGAKA